MAAAFEKFCDNSPIWNDSLILNNSWPQFTDCFQETVLIWVPCGWLWVTLPFYIGYVLSSQDGIPIPVNSFNLAKTFFSMFLFFLAVIDIIKDASDVNPKRDGSVDYVSGGILAASFLVTTILVQFERSRGFITSAILYIFWLLLFIAGIIPFYTKIINKEYENDLFRFVLYYIYFAFVFVELILHTFAESRSRRGYHEPGERQSSPETKASFPSQVTFSWINYLILLGYRKSIEEEDLFELNPRDDSEKVVPEFEEAWNKALQKTKQQNEEIERKYNLKKHYTGVFSNKAEEHHLRNEAKSSNVSEKTPLLTEGSTSVEQGVSFKGTKDDAPKKKEASLLKVLFKTYGFTLLWSFVLKAIYDLLQFVSPILQSALIDFTQNRDTKPDWQGYVYAGGFFVIATIMSCFYHYSFHISMTLGMRIKSALIAAIYKKALTISSEAKKQTTVGEIVNLMSVDCQRVQDVTGYLYMLWSSPLIISVALYMLYQSLGASIFAGLGVMILLMPLNAFIATKLRKYQMAQMKLKDQRIKLMNEVLNGIKVLKLYAWELSFQEKILAIRDQELTILRKSAYLNAVGTFAWTCAPYLVTLATFATYVLSSDDHYLDAQKAFVSLSLFNILRMPINLLPMIIPYCIQGWVSIGRLSKFLRSTDLDLETVSHIDSVEAVVKIDNGTFRWDKTLPKPTLRNINIDITEGKLVAIVGQVGSGKSSLISSLLGELEKVSGNVNIKGSIAYVPQEAWIQNATVKDNILFGSRCKHKTYDRVLEACALKPDLDILPGGDLTEIGEKGINLSGGQKQRVSLARAVYSNADIYLLDDPLSAVDSHVGKHIFEKVIGHEGTLKKKTRLLVTHGVHWLPKTDLIIVMNEGEISEVGSYNELVCHDGKFAQFLKHYLTEGAGSEDDDDPEIQAVKSQILERLESVTGTSDFATSGDDERTSGKDSTVRKRKPSTDCVEKKKIPAEVNKLIDAEKAEVGTVKLAVFIEYAKAIGGITTLLIFLIYLGYQVASVYSSIWLSQWTDDPYLLNRTLSKTTKYQDKNDMYLGVYGGLGVAQAVIILIFALLCSTRMVAAARTLHAKMLFNILRSPMSFFDTTPSGRIVNRFSRDIEVIDNNLPSTFRVWMSCFFGVLSTFVVIAYSNPIFLVVVLPLGLLYWLVQRFYIRTSRQLKRIESTTRSPIYTHFSETITGASSIRAYGASERFIEESQSRVDRNLVIYFSANCANRWLGFRLEFLGNIIVLAAAIFAVLATDLEGGLVGLSITYALQITMTLNWMVRMTSDLETNIVSVERVKEYSETPTEAAWNIPFRKPPRGWPDSGNIIFENLTTRYRPGLDLVLKGINCEVKSGEKIGIVGRTGAGKTSLSIVLFRLIEAVSGKIIIDGQHVADIGLHDLRSSITVLPQDPVLFSGSMKMNLDPFNVYKESDLWEALEHANLSKFVSEVPGKLEYEVGEGGQNLSVGQRQLVCLARTLLRKTKILVLDEATAAVDMETDDLIQQTIRTEFKDCTVLTIAHRLNTIMDYDRVMVLDNGLIKEFDQPDKLINDKETTFYSMAKDAGLT
ncbi:multidrug resistance-associated protein 1-like [Patella vulgata]|uniref:multidrug resistance-associated protein 1-like n=1 Tax=Patella vulgata TaxID=6465 RepID=UPI0024A9FB28|nr:multidrug resistance-associated protein 1-like [Patella vulgata]